MQLAVLGLILWMPGKYIGWVLTVWAALVFMMSGTWWCLPLCLLFGWIEATQSYKQLWELP
jgi:hypothetical protein